MNNNDEKNSVQEINIVDLLQIIVNGIWTLIKKVGSFFGWLGCLAYQQKLIVGLCTLIGIGVGVYFSSHKVYRGEVEIKINLNDAYFYKNVIDPLYNQCRYGDYENAEGRLDRIEELEEPVLDCCCEEKADGQATRAIFWHEIASANVI